MRAGGLLHILKRIGMTTCTAVLLRKTEALVDIHEIRILGQVIGYIAVVVLLAHGENNCLQNLTLGIGAGLRPFSRQR